MSHIPWQEEFVAGLVDSAFGFPIVKVFVFRKNVFEQIPITEVHTVRDRYNRINFLLITLDRKVLGTIEPVRNSFLKIWSVSMLWSS